MYHNLAEKLRQRIREFGSKPSYVLFPEELKQGLAQGIFTSHHSVDRRDGTIITKATFEGRVFLCAAEKT
mgnify:CR=1 FL=1